MFIRAYISNKKSLVEKLQIQQRLAEEGRVQLKRVRQSSSSGENGIGQRVECVGDWSRVDQNRVEQYGAVRSNRVAGEVFGGVSVSLSMTLAVFGDVGLSLFLVGALGWEWNGSFQRYRHYWYMTIHINMASRYSPSIRQIDRYPVCNQLLAEPQENMKHVLSTQVNSAKSHSALKHNLPKTVFKMQKHLEPWCLTPDMRRKV